MFIKLDGSGALSQQIYHALRRAILAGQLAPGTRLPATRVLAHELGVSAIRSYSPTISFWLRAIRLGRQAQAPMSPLPSRT